LWEHSDVFDKGKSFFTLNKAMAEWNGAAPVIGAKAKKSEKSENN